MVDQQIETETSDEKRKRLGLKRTRKHRDKNKPPEEITSFVQIAEKWMRNDAALLKENPTLHCHLLASYGAIMGWEAEAEEIAEGVKNGLRAETRSAETADSTEIFPMPDLSFRDIKAVAGNKSTANYRAIEADAVSGKGLDDESEHYIRYGFRLRLSHDTLQNARENLVLYALRTHDQNLNWDIVREAIADCSSYNGFSPSADELKKLIQEHRGAREETAWKLKNA